MDNNCGVKPNRFFGQVQQHIKSYNGTFIAVEANSITHKLNSLPSLRIPIQQVMSSRITLRAGQTNYLLNHLGMGDNATFLAIVATYDEKSKFESDNYINYSYYSEPGKMYSLGQLLTLTGNSQNRIEQIYLHNPNQNHAVVIEVLVGCIDEYYNFFAQTEPSISKLTIQATKENELLYNSEFIFDSAYTLDIDYLIDYYNIRLFDKFGEEIEDVNSLIKLDKFNDSKGIFEQVEEITAIGWYQISFRGNETIFSINVIN